MKKRIFLIDNNNNIFGQADLTRWDKIKGWRKILGNIFKWYKNRFIDVKGFEVSMVTNDLENKPIIGLKPEDFQYNGDQIISGESTKELGTYEIAKLLMTQFKYNSDKKS